MVAQLLDILKGIDWTVLFGNVNCIVCEFHLKKTQKVETTEMSNELISVVQTYHG